MHIPFPFEDTPTFAEIAAEWSRLPGAPSEPDILTRLVSAVWRGEFERSGDQPSSMIFLFRKPENRKEIGGATVEYLDDDGVVTKTVWQRVEGVLDDIILEDAATAEREAISLSRHDLLNALEWTGHSVRYREATDAFTALAAQPLAFYKPLSRTHHIDVLRLTRADLAVWFEGSGLPWPRPAWLPSECETKERRKFIAREQHCREAEAQAALDLTEQERLRAECDETEAERCVREAAPPPRRGSYEVLDKPLVAEGIAGFLSGRWKSANDAARELQSRAMGNSSESRRDRLQRQISAGIKKATSAGPNVPKAARNIPNQPK